MMKRKDRKEEESALREEQKRQPIPPEAADTTGSAAQTAAEKAQGIAAPVPNSKAALVEAENLDLKDKLLRKQAEFENFRKRMLRERDEAARYANAALLTDLIGVIDDFERAIRSAEESRDFSAFLTGISMMEKQLVELLENRWGLKRFNSVGEGFDPNKHEAVLKTEGKADAKPTVVEDFQKGYYLNERVLRPAKVKVMVPATVKGDEAPQQADAGAGTTDAGAGTADGGAGTADGGAGTADEGAAG